MFRRARSFWYGVRLPWEALKLICSKKTLLFWSILPVTLTLALYFLLIDRLQSDAKALLVSFLLKHGWSPEGWAAVLAFLLVKIALILVAAFSFSIVATIVASPFNDFLAESAERWVIPALPPVPASSLGWRGKMRLISIDLAKSVAAALAGLVALLVSWVPAVNFVALFLTFLLVAFQYLSYPQTRRGQGIRDGLLFLWRHSYACAGFGAAVMALFAIPLFSSLCLPLAVVGGTLLAARAPGGESLKPLK